MKIGDLTEYREWVLQKQKLETEMKTEIKKIEARYSPKILDLENLIGERAQELKVYAEEHQKEIFRDGRSTCWNGVTFGFKLCPPALKLAVTVEEAIKRIKKRFKTDWTEYIRVKEDLDKNAVKKLDPEVLEKLGLSVEKQEVFFIEVQ